MNTVQGIVKNTAARLVAQFVVAILSLALSIVIARSLGDAIFGKYSFAMETYINDQMFYGMFPGIWYASGKRDDYWADATLYERDRGMFKRCIPIIKEISSAGWEPIPYATADNRNIKFERYGGIEDGLYYTVGNSGSTTESGVLSVDLSKFGFGGYFVEVKELVTDVTSTQEVADWGVFITIQELYPNDTQVYRISP